MNAPARPQKLAYPYPDPPAPGAAVEVADGILWLRLPLPMALDHVNVYALREDEGWCLVDTGFDTKKTRGIWEELLKGPLGGLPVTRVIATHHHPDHIGLAGWFRERDGATLETSRTAYLLTRMLVLDRTDRPSPESIDHFRKAGMDAARLAERARGNAFNMADVVAPLPLGFTRLQDGQTIEAGGRIWTVYMGNGHAPEHVTMWCMDEPIILAGDQIIPSISPNLGVYATEPDADPVAEWLETCERFVPMARPDHLVLPGHKLPFTGLATRLDQLIENHHGALARLEAHLRETPRTAAECFPPLFKRQIGDSEYGLALVESIAHLNHLRATGRATRHLNEDGAYVWKPATA